MIEEGHEYRRYAGQRSAWVTIRVPGPPPSLAVPPTGWRDSRILNLMPGRDRSLIGKCGRQEAFDGKADGWWRDAR